MADAGPKKNEGGEGENKEVEVEEPTEEVKDESTNDGTVGKGASPPASKKQGGGWSKKAASSAKKRKRLCDDDGSSPRFNPEAFDPEMEVLCATCEGPTTMMDRNPTGARTPLKRDCCGCQATKSWVSRTANGGRSKMNKALRRAGKKGKQGGGASSPDSDAGAKSPKMPETQKDMGKVQEWLNTKASKGGKRDWFRQRKAERVDKEGSKRPFSDCKACVESSHAQSRGSPMQNGYLPFELWAAPKITCGCSEKGKPAETAFEEALQNPRSKKISHQGEWLPSTVQGIQANEKEAEEMRSGMTMARLIDNEAESKGFEDLAEGMHERSNQEATSAHISTGKSFSAAPKIEANSTLDAKTMDDIGVGRSEIMAKAMLQSAYEIAQKEAEKADKKEEKKKKDLVRRLGVERPNLETATTKKETDLLTTTNGWEGTAEVAANEANSPLRDFEAPKGKEELKKEFTQKRGRSEATIPGVDNSLHVVLGDFKKMLADDAFTNVDMWNAYAESKNMPGINEVMGDFMKEQVVKDAKTALDKVKTYGNEVKKAIKDHEKANSKKALSSTDDVGPVTGVSNVETELLGAFQKGALNDLKSTNIGWTWFGGILNSAGTNKQRPIVIPAARLKGAAQKILTMDYYKDHHNWAEQRTKELKSDYAAAGIGKVSADVPCSCSFCTPRVASGERGFMTYYVAGHLRRRPMRRGSSCLCSSPAVPVEWRVRSFRIM